MTRVGSNFLVNQYHRALKPFSWSCSAYSRRKRDLFVSAVEPLAVMTFGDWFNQQSNWVLKEVEYALRKKKTDMDPPEIVPIPIEGPPPVPPPHGLEHLHFNDYFLYFVQ
jgi:hypothetical protein